MNYETSLQAKLLIFVLIYGSHEP